MDLEISELDKEDRKTMSLIKRRLSLRWKMSSNDIQKSWIEPALASADFPYIFVAKNKGERIGEIFLSINPHGYLGINDQPWISGLFVSKNCRGHHLGEALIQKAKDKAAEKGYKEVFSDTVVAKGYYDKIGGWEYVGTALWEAGNQPTFVMKSSVS